MLALSDMMPTRLGMAGIPIPETVEGISLVSDECREYLYGEHHEEEQMNCKIRSERYKMIYYVAGNRFQLFDMQEDPDELHDLASDPAYADVLADHTQKLVDDLYGGDHLQLVRRGWSRLYMRDQIERLLVASLCYMHRVSRPVCAPPSVVAEGDSIR